VKIFVKNAEKTVATIENMLGKSADISDEDLNLFTINVHAMRSTLASVGETELSKIAFDLEEAGRAKVKAKVLAAVPDFLISLKAVIEKTKPKEEVGSRQQTSAPDKENSEFLYEKMQIIRTACEEYDKKAAKNALKELKEKKMPTEIDELLEEISEQILHGYFEKVAELTKKA
jgi:HPt (histidine-containing phosphotransfer) domain-containing protein